jgi:hypothetical protein
MNQGEAERLFSGSHDGLLSDVPDTGRLHRFYCVYFEPRMIDCVRIKEKQLFTPLKCRTKPIRIVVVDKHGIYSMPQFPIEKRLVKNRCCWESL